MLTMLSSLPTPENLVASSKWSEGWELILKPSKSSYLPNGGASKSVTYALTSRTSPYAQSIKVVSTVQDLHWMTMISLLLQPRKPVECCFIQSEPVV